MRKHTERSKYHGLNVAIDVLGFEIDMLQALVEESKKSKHHGAALRRIRLLTKIEHLETAIFTLKNHRQICA